MRTRETEYERVCQNDLREYIAATGHSARIYVRMVHDHGSHRAAALALVKPSLICQSGFYEAFLSGWDMARTVEGRVVEYADLFPAVTVREAQKRLNAVLWRRQLSE
jgi:hypothetical protein